MFHLLTQSKKSQIRQGVIETAHGKIKTPCFLPDATRGFIKLIDSEAARNVGVETLVVNTLHLYLQPGLKVIKKAGGLHQFMNWPGPLLSDSGGYQVFSLAKRKHAESTENAGDEEYRGMQKNFVQIYNDKVVFKSPIDGSRCELTPEKSIQIQFDLGGDMMVCLDDCRPNDNNRQEAEAAVERTIRWAGRCKKEYEKKIKNKKSKIKNYNQPLLFGVIQGGIFPDLRKKCARELVKIGFDGLGFGARPVDENGEFLQKILETTVNAIPKNYLRFALGIGTPEDILRCVKMGWDIFDCVIPTREARHGRLYNFQFPSSNFSRLRTGPRQRRWQINSKFQILGSKNFYKVINILNSKYKQDFSLINENSKIQELQNYSKAYLHHLFKVNEFLGQRLATLNNLEFYHKLMNKISQF